jgi:hypothetical protein
MLFYRVPQPSEFSWQSREVIKELSDKPHLLVSIEITGPYFPHRAPEPFVSVRPDLPATSRSSEQWSRGSERHTSGCSCYIFQE